MPALARFKELCLDTDSESEAVARFWAATTGGTFVPEGTTGDVLGREEHESLVFCRVPEPKTVKHRVHLDVYARSVEELVGRGATVLVPAAESGFGWTVMADPDGGEFCAFVRDELPAYRLHGIAVDCADAEAQARWWGEVYDVPALAHEEGAWWTLEHTTPDPVLTLDFAPVPEPKVVKNRLHWDVYGDVDALLAHGATRLWDTGRWVVLADPEGNEFCVFPEPSATPTT
jgi:predicted enzyme related to lactoylglutathione lyase